MSELKLQPQKIKSKKWKTLLSIGLIISALWGENFICNSDYSNFAKRKNVGIKQLFVGKEDRNLEAEKQYQQQLKSLGQNQNSQGDQKLYALYFWDNCQEDGDVISLNVNGENYGSIPLFHKQTPVFLKLKPGENLIIITGMKDGGGGITVGVSSQNSTGYGKVLAPGESESFSIINQ